MPTFTDPPDAAETRVIADEDDLATRGCILLRCHRSYMRWFARLDHPKHGRRSVSQLRVLSFIAREGRDGRKPGQIAGRSPYLQAVHGEGPTSLIGEIAEVDIVSAGPNSLTGVIKSEFEWREPVQAAV